MSGETSPGIPEAREIARRLFFAGLEAADPGRAVRAALEVGPGETATLAGERFARPRSVKIVAAGKAAVAMARASIERIPRSLLLGVPLVVTTDDAAGEVPGARVLRAGHPLPDARGLEAAAEIERYISGAGPGDGLIVLLSGGASALLPAPVPGISLEDKRETTELLLQGGADIRQCNAVRKHLSRLKGGRLAERAAPAAVEALIVSDVVGDDVSTIASGPTAPDPTTYREAIYAVFQVGVLGIIPQSVRRYMALGSAGKFPETPKPGSPIFKRVRNRIVANARTALEGARSEAQRLGFPVKVISSALEGEAREVGKSLAREAAALARSPGFAGPLVCLAAGETTVRVLGSGLGGRNQELALAFALEAESCGLRGSWVFLSAGTDGRDGPTDAAGAVVDPGTLARGEAAGRWPWRDLQENDSYRFLEAAGDLLRTGPTGTNVGDLQVLILRGDR